MSGKAEQEASESSPAVLNSYMENKNSPERRRGADKGACLFPGEFFFRMLRKKGSVEIGKSLIHNRDFQSCPAVEFPEDDGRNTYDKSQGGNASDYSI